MTTCIKINIIDKFHGDIKIVWLFTKNILQPYHSKEQLCRKQPKQICREKMTCVCYAAASSPEIKIQ